METMGDGEHGYIFGIAGGISNGNAGDAEETRAGPRDTLVCRAGILCDRVGSVEHGLSAVPDIPSS
jgi:hypothetical protein